MKRMILNMMILSSFLFIFASCKAQNKDSPITISSPWDGNYKMMLAIKSYLNVYRNENSTFPVKSNEKAYSEFEKALNDHFGNKMLYFSDGNNYILMSLGQDLNSDYDDSYIMFIDGKYYEHFYDSSLKKK